MKFLRVLNKEKEQFKVSLDKLSYLEAEIVGDY